jgi:hypothetical protein
MGDLIIKVMWFLPHLSPFAYLPPWLRFQIPINTIIAATLYGWLEIFWNYACKHDHREGLTLRSSLAFLSADLRDLPT